MLLGQADITLPSRKPPKISLLSALSLWLKSCGGHAFGTVSIIEWNIRSFSKKLALLPVSKCFVCVTTFHSGWFWIYPYRSICKFGTVYFKKKAIMPLEWHFCNLDCQVLLCWDSSFSLISLFFRSCQMNDICQIPIWCQKFITIYWINKSQKCWGVVNANVIRPEGSETRLVIPAFLCSCRGSMKKLVGG